MSYTIQTKDGQVKFSSFITEYSGFFADFCEKRANFENGPICYDGSKGSEIFDNETVKCYWDIRHGIQEKLLISIKNRL